MVYAEPRGKGEYPWRVRYLRPDGSTASASGFSTEEDAINHGLEQEADIRRGIWMDPRKGATPFGPIAWTWLQENPRAPKTDEGRRYLLHALICPRWGTTPIGEINWYVVKTWADRLAIAEHTVNRAVSLMSTILTAAVDATMIGNNPLAGRRRSTGVKNPVNIPPKATVWPHPEQAAGIASRLPAVEGLMELTQAFMGPRWGELAAIHRKRSFAVRTDTIGRKAWTRRVLLIRGEDGALEDVEVVETDDGVETKSRILRLAPPKNAGAVREIDMPPFLEALFDAHHAVWPHEYSFSTGTGAFRHLSNFDKKLKKAAAGWPESPARRGTSGRLAAEPILPGLSSHGNRHAQATWMEEDNLSDILKHYILGHRPPGIRGVYAHPSPAMRRARIEAMQARWERSGVADVYFAGECALKIPG